MFTVQQGAPQIAQGATLYILNRKEFTVDTAVVQAVSQPHMSKSAISNPAMAMQGFVIDLTVAMGNDTTTIEFPVNATSANYPDKGWYLSTDRFAVSREVDAMSAASKQFLSQREWNEMVVEKAPALLMQLNPEKKMEAQQAQQIAELQGQLAAMNEKFDKLVGMFSAGSANTKKTKED